MMDDINAIKAAIESIKKSQWQNKDEVIKNLKEKLNESRIETSYSHAAAPSRGRAAL
jgi:hypothetical protein